MSNDAELRVPASFELAIQQLRALELLDDGAEPDLHAVVEGMTQWASLDITVEGANYHGTVPTNLARGLWELQQELYRAVAFAQFGAENYKKIPRADLAQLTLVFEVSDGCSFLTAPLEKFAEKLAEGMLGKMTAKQIAVTVVLSTAAVTFGWAMISLSEGYFDHRTAVETAQIAAQQDMARTQLEKERILAEVERDRVQAGLITGLVAANPIAQRFQEASVEGAKAVVKSARDARSVRLGAVEFDRQQITEITQRADREGTETVEVAGSFVITVLKRPAGSSVVRFTVANEEGEVPVIMDFTDEGAYSPEQLATFWKAVEKGTRVSLVVQKRMMGDKIKHAWVDSIVVPAPDGDAPPANQ